MRANDVIPAFLKIDKLGSPVTITKGETAPSITQVSGPPALKEGKVGADPSNFYFKDFRYKSGTMGTVKYSCSGNGKEVMSMELDINIK